MEPSCCDRQLRYHLHYHGLLWVAQQNSPSLQFDAIWTYWCIYDANFCKGLQKLFIPVVCKYVYVPKLHDKERKHYYNACHGDGWQIGKDFVLLKSHHFISASPRVCLSFDFLWNEVGGTWKINQCVYSDHLRVDRKIGLSHVPPIDLSRGDTDGSWGDYKLAVGLVIGYYCCDQERFKNCLSVCWWCFLLVCLF
jgi:hypothetical protein